MYYLIPETGFTRKESLSIRREAYNTLDDAVNRIRELIKICCTSEVQWYDVRFIENTYQKKYLGVNDMGYSSCIYVIDL